RPILKPNTQNLKPNTQPIVQQEGVEPSWSCLQPGLSRPRLPFRHCRMIQCPWSDSNAHCHASETCPSTGLGYKGKIERRNDESITPSPHHLITPSLHHSITKCLRRDLNAHCRGSQPRLSAVLEYRGVSSAMPQERIERSLTWV